MTSSDESAVYLAGLRLAGRRVVVVGGGAVAARRIAGLLAARADVVCVAPQVTPAVLALAQAGRIVWHEREYQRGDLAEGWYAVAATDLPEVNAAVAREAHAARVFCSRADTAGGEGDEASTAWTPASGRHGGVEIAVLSPGAHEAGDPRRSALVRDAVVEQLRAGTLAAPRFRGRAAGVALVGGGPGDPDLITVRGRRLLAEADVVVADRLAPHALLDELSPDVEVVDAAKIPYGRSMAQEEINRILVDRARAGKFVVRLKGGDPYVFGRGYEELLACAEAGIAVMVVPGVTSAVSVPALAGIPVTHRGVAHEFTVVSGHLAPEDPRSLVDWAALARMRGTVVLLMAVERIEAIVRTLVGYGKDPDTPAAVVSDGSMPGQESVIGSLRTLPDLVARAGVRPPAIVVIGPVVAAGLGVRGAAGGAGEGS